MTEKLLTILQKCKNKRGSWTIMPKGQIGFEVFGFSKSGSVTLYEEDGKIICLARYDERDEIESYDDLAHIAYSWHSRYKDRDVFSSPPSEWAEDFARLGLMKKKTVTTYE
jgi:hypothetical protein